MKYTISTDASLIIPEKWDYFVQSHTNGNFFQSYSFYRLTEKTSQNVPFGIFALSSENELIGVLLGVIQREQGISSFFSRRLIITGGPLTKDNNLEIAGQLILKISQIAQGKTIYTEFRNLYDISEFKSAFNKSNYTYKAHLNYHVLLDNENHVKKQMSESRLRQIKKSFKNGGIIQTVGTDDIFFEKWYAILKKLYRNKIRKPLPDINLLKDLVNQGMGVLLVVLYNKTVCGGILCPIYKDTIYEWYICGEDDMFRDIYPSVLATWAALDYGLTKNLRVFDFLGAGSVDKDYGVKEFKARFGGIQVEYGRFIKINNRLLYFIGGMGLRLYNLFSK
jgi:serine/alanine adding enzyme